MMLGDTECDDDYKYFMKHGKYPPSREHNITFPTVFIDDSDDAYRQFIEANNWNWERERTYKFVIYG